MFRKIALAAAGAALVAVPVAADAQGYYYGRSYPAYGYNGYAYPSYGYGYSYPAYGYSNYGYGYPAYGYGYSNRYYGFNNYGNSNAVGAALIGGVIGLAIGSAITSGNHHHHRYYRRYR